MRNCHNQEAYLLHEPDKKCNPWVAKGLDAGKSTSSMRAAGNINTVGYATTKECYNEQFLSIISGCYNEHRCYNERGGILFIMEILIIVFTRERVFMQFMRVRLFLLGKVCS
jgi:hypothetical protein